MTIRGYISITDLEKLVCTKLLNIGIHTCDYPINPYCLIQNENIILQEIHLNDTKIRGMTVHGENRTGIMINSNCGLFAKRFIAMHELSHIWFHPHKTKRVCIEDYKKLRRGEEWQANNAAAIALMPTSLVYDIYEHYEGNTEYMCDFFGVGAECMNYRLESLNLSKPIITISDNKFINYEPDSIFATIESQWLYGK